MLLKDIPVTRTTPLKRNLSYIRPLQYRPCIYLDKYSIKTIFQTMQEHPHLGRMMYSSFMNNTEDMHTLKGFVKFGRYNKQMEVYQLLAPNDIKNFAVKEFVQELINRTQHITLGTKTLKGEAWRH